jgi:two-component sensor histidine kinase
VSEERHRLAVEANKVGTWDYDLISNEGRWSDQAKQLLGLPLDVSPSAEVFRSMVSPEDWFAVQERWRAALDPANGGHFISEHQVSRLDDSIRRWLYFAGQVFFDERSGKPLRAVGIVLDSSDRKEVEERQRVMLREMNHRVKNTLAVVQAIVSQTIRLTRDPQEAFEQIQSRVMSIARTHDFLDQSHVGESSIRGLVALELEPLAGDTPLRLRLGGPSVLLGSSAVLSLGLTLHELGTNAVKYGALAVPEGRVEVSWFLRDDKGRTFVDLLWKESGGPTVRTPKRKGFGSRLIEGSIAGTLGGSVSIDYDPAGIVARLSFPFSATAH